MTVLKQSNDLARVWAYTANSCQSMLNVHFRAFRWHKRFIESREEVEDDEPSRRPATSRIDKNVKKVANVVRTDHRLSILMIYLKISALTKTLCVKFFGRISTWKTFVKKLLLRFLHQNKKEHPSYSLWYSPLRLFYFPQNKICAKRNPF